MITEQHQGRTWNARLRQDSRGLRADWGLMRRSVHAVVEPPPRVPSPGAPPIVVPDPAEPIPQPAPGAPPIVVPDPTEPMPEPIPQPAPPEPPEPEPRPSPPVLMPQACRARYRRADRPTNRPIECRSRESAGRAAPSSQFRSAGPGWRHDDAADADAVTATRVSDQERPSQPAARDGGVLRYGA